MKKQRELELVMQTSEADKSLAIKAIFRCIDSIRKEKKNEKQERK